MHSKPLIVKIKNTMNINDLLKTRIKKGKIWLFQIECHELNDSISISAYNSLDIDNSIFDNRQLLTIPNFATEYKFLFHKNDKAEFYRIRRIKYSQKQSHHFLYIHYLHFVGFFETIIILL